MTLETPFEPIGPGGPKIFGLSIKPDILFSSHKGVYKKRIEKRQRKLIVKLPFLKPFLSRDENILLVTTGYSPLASLAQYVTGFIFVYLQRALIIFTNKCIYLVPTSPTYKYKNSIAQIPYSGCQSIRIKQGCLAVTYAKSNRVEKFRGIPIAERKKIKALMSKHIPLSASQKVFAERRHLCPRCTRQLKAKTVTCEKCDLKFKSKRLAVAAAILLPGGGYFYTRHYLLGFLNFLIEMFLLAFIGVAVKDTLAGMQNGGLYLIILPLIYILIKTISVIHSSHFISEFIPMDKTIKSLVSINSVP